MPSISILLEPKCSKSTLIFEQTTYSLFFWSNSYLVKQCHFRKRLVIKKSRSKFIGAPTQLLFFTETLNKRFLKWSSPNFVSYFKRIWATQLTLKPSENLTDDFWMSLEAKKSEQIPFSFVLEIKAELENSSKPFKLVNS